MVQRDFVGAWVNSAQSLWLLPYFVCVVFAARIVNCYCCCGHCRLLFVLCLRWWQRDFVGAAWVNSAQSLRLLPAFVCVVCCVRAGAAGVWPMAQRQRELGVVVNSAHRCGWLPLFVSCLGRWCVDFWPMVSCAVPCATPLHLPRQRCALSMGLENKKTGRPLGGGMEWLLPGAWLVMVLND